MSAQWAASVRIASVRIASIRIARIRIASVRMRAHDHACRTAPVQA
jgi:hypothetical protein